MKQAKRVLVFMLCAVMLLALAACGGKDEEKIVGKWVVTKASIDTRDMNPEELGTRITFEFKKDGTFIGEIMGKKYDGKWSGSGDEYTIDIDGVVEKAVLADGSLSITHQGMLMVLEPAK